MFFKIGMIDICVVMIVDFIFGVILFIFKEWNNMLMSMIWVFFGLFVGCEIVMFCLFGEKML